MEVTEIGREPGIREECSWLDLEPNEESQDERADYRNNNNPLYLSLIHISVPTSSQIVSRSSIPNNLGMVIKSRMLRQFDDLVSQEKAQTESKPADP